MRVTDAWARLGIAPTGEAREVKRAYAAALKAIDVDLDPKAFIELREARDLALQWGGELPEWEREDYDPDAPWAEDEFREEDGGEVPGQGFPIDLGLSGIDPFWGGHRAGGAARPEAVASANRALSEAAARLEALLSAEDASASEVEAAGAALLNACDEASVDDSAEMERWLRQALAQAIPRSDPVFPLADARFGWSGSAFVGGNRHDPDLYDLLDRQDARATVARLRQHGSVDERDALAELTRPGRSRLGWFEFGIARSVRMFLNEAVAANRMIEHDLDPGTLAWWQGYFEGRHLPGAFWSLLLLPVSLTAGLSLFGAIDKDFATIGLTFAAAEAAILVVILLYAELSFRARKRAREQGWWDYGSGKVRLLVLAAMLLPVGAAFAPVGVAASVATGIAAAALGAAALFLTPAPRRTDYDAVESMTAIGFPAAGLVAAATICVAAVMGGTLADGTQLGFPLLILCLIVSRAYPLATGDMANLKRTRARAILAATGLSAAGMLVSLFCFTPALPPVWLLALAPAVVMAQHLATGGTTAAVRLIEWGARAGAILFHIIVGKRLFEDWGRSIVASLLLYLLVYSLIRIAVAWRWAGRAADEPAYF